MNDLIAKWSGQFVVASYDQPTGTWIFIAVHDTTLGRAVGGCRLRVYETPEEGLQDAMRLAEGMTYKWAAIGFPLGGGKSVLAVPGELDPPVRVGLLQRFGRILESLKGAYATGEDLGTTPEDMAVVAQVTQWVKGSRPNGLRAVDPGPYTALGVFVGIRAAARYAYGSDDLQDRTVLIQGVGDVGEPLARKLKTAGAEILISDLNEPLARRVASELDGEAVEPHLAYARTCDIYAPCAVGATLNAQTIPQLHCRIVAGSANNQLAEDGDADILHDHGIVYVPDYIVNAGGAIALPSLDEGSLGEDQIRARIEGIGHTIGELLAEADRENESPVRAARRMVDRVLQSKREEAVGRD